jgi:outer membrane protein assembly factor BamB
VQWKLNIVEEYKVVCPGYGFAGSPVVEGDLLIITVNSWGIALDKKTGGLVWTSPPVDYKKEVSNGTGSLYATPVVYSQNNKRYAFILSGYGLYSVEVDSGKPNWFYKWNPSDKIADPIIFNNKVFISTAEDFVGCVLLDINGEKPKVLWENKNLLNDINTSVLIDGYLYGCHGPVRYQEAVLRCANFETGEVMWEKDLGQQRSMSLSAAGDKLIILDNKGVLHIANASPKVFDEISSAQLFEGSMLIKCWTSPVLCGGKIYCRNYPSELWCIDVRK